MKKNIKNRSIAIINILLVTLSCILIGGCGSISGPEPKKAPTAKPEAIEDIKLNSLGYLPAAQKKVTIISKCSDFSVKKAGSNKVVYTGKVSGPFSQQDVGQTVWIADFSEVNKPGKYYLDVPGIGKSYRFEISDKVYDSALYTATRAFYMWRCGTAVEGDYNGIHFSHPACHLNEGLLDYVGEPNGTKDGAGGWHDAGDYYKYTVNAGVTVASLFWAWEHYPNKLKDLSLNIPDTAPGYPDFLKEIKWEIDWLFKMRYPDGSGRVYHKLSALNFCSFVMPERERFKQYYVSWSSTGTADFVAIMAMSARVFKPYDAEYAQKCLDAAKLSYDFLTKNPGHKKAEQDAFKTGTYRSLDHDDRLWAAAEMWETTGDANYLKDFETRAAKLDDKISLYWDWSDVNNLGMFTYISSSRGGKNNALVEDIKKDLLATADKIVAKTKKDVYGRPIEKYNWGYNGTVAREVITLMMANKILPNPDYVNAAQSAVDHIFGRNYYCRSYVTGLGHNPPMKPHDRRCGADKIDEPWPGYIVGGGHSATDWQDIQSSASTNEIAINWQAALVYALAAVSEAQTK
ncbi:MAG: glycoside hydrolase family 9 protein [Phycisphaerae bacterium]|nr:glycoside hydrolase family 9 protein [Phycisphaerae bacterium]